MKLTIKRSEWSRGGAGYLYKKDTGKGCVIGHYMLACGLSRDDLHGWGDPGELFSEKGWEDSMTDNDDPLHAIIKISSEKLDPFTTDAGSKAMEINDSLIDDNVREAQLIELLAGWGTELEFI